MGRPRKYGDVNLDTRLEVRLLADEKATWQEASEAAGMPLSEWIRAVVNEAAKRRL